jgi:hypothetical protein
VNDTSLPQIVTDDVKIVAERSAETLTVIMTGTADLRVQDQLSEFLVTIDKLCTEAGVAEVTVDVQKLEFMNSACFKAFVSWIGRLQDREEAHQYRIRFLSDPRMLWQRRSLHALSCFAADLISIETT